MLNFMENLAREAGTMALEQRKHLSSAGLHFKNERDLVTDVDRQVENFIKTNISRQFPDHAILAEESGISQERGSEYLWVIDPIDGTTSFVHDMPFYSVSIALRRNGDEHDLQMSPSADDVIGPGDVVVTLGRYEDIDLLHQL